MMLRIEDMNWGLDALDMTAYDNNGRCGNSGHFFNTKGAKREPYDKDNLSYKFADVKGTFEKGFITGLAYADQELIGLMLEDDGDGAKPKGKYAEALRDAQEQIAAEIQRHLWSILDAQECEEDGDDER